MRGIGHRVHARVPAAQGLLAVPRRDVEQRRLEGGGKHELEVLASQGRKQVLVADDLTLLGHLDLAFERAVRLREDRAVRRAAATSDRAAASVEQAEANAVPAADVAQAPLRLVDLPLRRRDTGLLVRVAVAQHHLLDVAPGSDDASVRHVRQECVDDVVCGPQLLRGLQQRHETDPRHARVHIDEPRFPGDQCRARTSSAPCVTETMYDSMTSGPKRSNE